MRLKSENGMVTFLMVAGKDLVQASMSVASAQAIIKSSNDVQRCNRKDYPICVDNKWFFPEAIDKPRKKTANVSENTTETDDTAKGE